MEVYSDAVGNLFGRITGNRPEVVMTGSHRDTVRRGGKYDGMLGVLTAIEAAASLTEELGSQKNPWKLWLSVKKKAAVFLPVTWAADICAVNSVKGSLQIWTMMQSPWVRQ